MLNFHLLSVFNASLDGNPDLCQNNACNTTTTTTTKKKSSNTVPIVIGSIAAVVVFLGAIIAVYCFCKSGGRHGT